MEEEQGHRCRWVRGDWPASNSGIKPSLPTAEVERRAECLALSIRWLEAEWGFGWGSKTKSQGPQEAG